MSLSIAIVGSDGIVLATDRRVTTQNKNSGMRAHYDSGKKLWVLEKQGLVAGITTVSNNKGYQEWLVKTFIEQCFNYTAPNTKERNHEIHTFNQLVERFSLEMKTAYELYTRGMTKEFISRESFNLGFTLVGHDSSGNPYIYYLHSESAFAPDMYHDYYVSGIPTLAEHFLERLRTALFRETEDGFKPLTSTETLKVLAVLLIRETHSFTDTVSNSISMRIFRRADLVETVGKSELNQIIHHVDNINTQKNLIKLLKLPRKHNSP